MGWKENRYQYQKAYVLNHYTLFTVVMNREKDKDLIAHLQTKKNAAVNNLLTEYYQKGMITSMAIILLGYYNTADDYVAEDKQAEFFKKMEEEVNRIIQEELSQDYMVMSEVAAYKIMEIRQKYGMET